MTQAVPAPELPKAGGTLKTILILVIVILLVGVAGGVYLILPEQNPDLRPFQWPPEGEAPLEITATLSDGSAVLLTNVRFETVPIDLAKSLAKVREEFVAKKSVITSVLTEVANLLSTETALTSVEFRRQAARRINEELTQSEIDRVLIKDWVVHPSE